jgi:hypothetical protein
MPTTAPDGPGVDPVQVGAITFRTTEAPTRIGLGAGKHDVAVTEYPGGGRDVKAMGAQPKTVTLKVQLWNPGIDDNLDLLQAYMALGREVYVSWRAERYYAIITDFTPEWHNKNRVDVELVFEITRDDNGVFSDATDESVDDKVMALLGTAAQTNVQVLSLPQPEPPTPDYSGIQIQGQGGGTGNAFAPAMAGGTSPSVLNVLAHPLMPPVAELAKLGVARVSMGSRPMYVALTAFRNAALQLRDTGSFAFPDGAITYAEANALVAKK